MTAAPSVIRSARKAAGLTQSQLAERLGRRQATVAGLERPGANPTLATLEEALHATGHRLELRAVPAKSSIDETLVADRLGLTPAQRLRAFEVAHAEVDALRAAGARAGLRGG